jgi:hypothetical protein
MNQAMHCDPAAPAPETAIYVAPDTVGAQTEFDRLVTRAKPLPSLFRGWDGAEPRCRTDQLHRGWVPVSGLVTWI